MSLGTEYFNSSRKLNQEGIKYTDEQKAIQVLKDRTTVKLPVDRWIENLEYNPKEDLWYADFDGNTKILHDYSLRQVLEHIKCAGLISTLKTLQNVDDLISSRCCLKQHYEKDAEVEVCLNCGTPRDKIPRSNVQMERAEKLCQTNWKELRENNDRKNNVYAMETTDVLGSSIRAFPTEGITKDGKAKGYHYIPDYQAMELAQEIMPENARFLEARISPISTEFKYSIDTKEFNGEKYEIGFSVGNSEFKFKSYTFHFMIFQEVCTNGLTVLKGQAVERIRHNKNEDAFITAVKSAYKRLQVKADSLWQMYVGSLEKFSSKIVDNWEEFVNRNFLKLKSVNELYQIKEIAEEWEYDTTPSGIIKALTNYSSNTANRQRRERINLRTNYFLTNIASIVEQIESEIII